MKLLDNDFAIVNEIGPDKTKWAWELYLKGCKNNWMPTEVPMAKDIEQWRGNVLSDDEKLLVKRCLGFFAGSESLVSNNLFINIAKWVTDGNCRNYIGRQIFEETLHNLTLVYICGSLGLHKEEVYQAYRRVPCIQAKDDFLRKATRDTGRPDFTTETFEGKQDFLRNLITFYIICEGIFFYSGFAMLLNFNRFNKLPGISEQIGYTIRDESIHLEFGTNLINQIVYEYSEIWTEQFKAETIKHVMQACNLEIEYAKDCLPNGILGLNSEMFIDYMKFISGRRLRNIGLPDIYEVNINPFPWLSESMDLTKVKNFFETRVQEYATGLHDDLE